MKFVCTILFSILLSSCGGQAQLLPEPEPEYEIEGDWMVLPMPAGVYADTNNFNMEAFEVVVPGLDWIETKVDMDMGKAIIYRWELVEDETTTAQTAQNIYTEFHGHKPRVEGELGELMYYRKAVGGYGQGFFRSPFTGIHGWFFDNTNEQDITIRIQIAGEFSKDD